MALAPEQTRIGLHRWFTIEGVHPDDELEWERRSVVISNALDGTTTFEQNDVEFPAGWSETATKIVAQKYFRGQLGTPQREWSLRQVIDRVVTTIADWGEADGYFADAAEAATFRAELTWLLLNQRAAFNSPVWFNIGVADVPQQSSACFILSVDDDMDSILNWYVEEGRIFKGGSGSGVNLSAIRSSKETMAGGGSPSGPVSFMRGADASAGTIKSGGKTRRAAKMVVLDVDHPDVEEFIWCKAREEDKARALAAAGFDMSLDGADVHSLQYQNANNSVRLSDEFMRAAVDGRSWDLTARTDGSVIESVPARDLLGSIAEAAWQCADPGVQFETTINRWHTSPAAGPINASNPCSEYLHLDDSACNLASLNLLSFLGDDDQFDVEGFRSACQVVITAQEILVGHSSYPTEAIGANTRRYRQLGLGYTNLGALLMASGLAYDSDAGRATAAAITSLMCGEAYATSSRVAARMGAYDGYADDRDAMLAVLDMHRTAAQNMSLATVDPELASAATTVWDTACEQAEQSGVRNAQATVLAPTGTISFMMDCDTTGIEPDFALVKHKQLVGGGFLSIVNQTVARALRKLGYAPSRIDEIVQYLDTTGTIHGAPGLNPDHLAVFACSVGDGAISASGHISMMAAVQPFLSGGISKTVNLPESATPTDIEDLLIDAWRTGVKAVAVYRDNCKVAQPLSAGGADDDQADKGSADGATATTAVVPVRERMPRSRTSRTFEFRVADCKGFVTVGEYDDGRPGEIFVRVSKQGSTLAGIMDAFAISLSHGLQYGVPLSAFVQAFVGMRFEPAGMTDDPDVRIASSLIDYLFRRLAIDYLSAEERAALNIFTIDERTQPTLPGVVEATTTSSPGIDLIPEPATGAAAPALWESVTAPAPVSPGQIAKPVTDSGAPMCMDCGTLMVRAGSCYACQSCGNTSGCS
ncbi:MAG: vitamin B12-dependent ribonucleotide reductase [Actinomycetota bacterium]